MRSRSVNCNPPLQFVVADDDKEHAHQDMWGRKAENASPAKKRGWSNSWLVSFEQLQVWMSKVLCA